MKKTLILFDSKYGATKEIAKTMSLVLGPSKYCEIDEFNDDIGDYDLIVIGSPVYKESLSLKILNFIEGNLSTLIKKQIAVFCTCLAGKNGSSYLKSYFNSLGDSIIWSESFGGRLILNELTEEDYASMNAFSKMSGYPLNNVDTLNLENIIESVLEIKYLRDKHSNVDREVLTEFIEKFLHEHNTCTLSTSYKTRLRGTPIEYSYKDGYFYFVSEGGEKFANILLNKSVALSIYNSFEGMDKLESIQISGEAELIPIGSKDYKEIMKGKGIKYNKLPFNLNMFKVKAVEAEILWSGFSIKGYDVKQYFKF